MPVKLQIDTEEIKRWLRQLPDELRDEGRAIVTEHVDAAEATIRSSYAAMTKSAAYGVDASGNLQRGLYQNKAESRFGVRVTLRNRAPHAWLVENGSELRHFRGASRGRMPAAKIFVPTVMRARRAMWRDLVALVERNGLTVTGG